MMATFQSEKLRPAMTDTNEPRTRVRHYFVDESGDATLFDRHGRVVAGTEGCSSYFMLGLLDVSDPTSLDQEITLLRKRLLADPYFNHVPSMQPEAKKTARAFHAKDDVPEVRREVFALLMRHELRFFAVVRHKHRIVELVRDYNQVNPSYRYHPNQLYDRLVSRLFKERLHKDDGYRIHFAKRGSKSRTAALQNALEVARNNFRKSWGITSNAPIEVLASRPEDAAGLQAADYFLWALQRLYERGDERYWNYIWPAVSLVYDIDDTRNKPYGEYYSQKNPLTLAACAKKKPEI